MSSPPWPTLPPLVVLIPLLACVDAHPRPPVVEEPVVSDWAEVQARDTLVALVQYNSTGYFLYRGEPMGFEYEMLAAFAEEHDLAFRTVVLEDPGDWILRLNRGEGDVVAARLIPSQLEAREVLFTHRLYETQATLVQRSGAGDGPDLPAPVDSLLGPGRGLLPGDEAMDSALDLPVRLVEDAAELGGRTVVIPGQPALHERLLEIQDSITGDIEIVELEGDARTETLLRRVAAGGVSLAAAPEELARLSAGYYQNLVVRPTLGGGEGVSWAVRRTSPELLRRLDEWIAEPESRTLAAVLYRKYYVDRQGYRERSRSGYLSSETGRISEFDPLLKSAAAELGWDWRLLAAQVYQESRFQPRARSWAGAMGLLQLMPGTARELGVDAPFDPEQNIRGGARYLATLSRQWAETIGDPEQRLRFVLASYNAGRGHVLDAQRLAVAHGDDQTAWNDVAYWLLQKSRRPVYTHPVVRHGFVRGLEPVTYVGRILDLYGNYRQLVDAGGPQASPSSIQDGADP